MEEVVPIKKHKPNVNTGDLENQADAVKINYLNIQQFILKKEFHLQLRII
jgi:hypothetical protein